MQHRSPPVVALVGRPNVGKSTLFNRLVRKRLALVYDQPGVTRDRLAAELVVESGRHEHAVTLLDTAGVTTGSAAEDGLAHAAHQHTLEGLEGATLALLVVDGRMGATPFDVEAARLLRRAGKPFLVVVNKVDEGQDGASLSSEFYALDGIELFVCSAEHARGIDTLRDAVGKHLAGLGALDETTQVALPAEDEAPGLAVPTGGEGGIEWHGEPIRVAVVGRPNAGKSSLINAILGETRLLASPEAGTTRDAVDSPYERDGQPYVLVDTAGLRRTRNIDTRLEALSASLALRSMQSADVVVLVMDATQRPSEQDAKIAALADARGKGLVLVASQWDRIENPEWRERYPKAIRLDLSFVSYAPLVSTSAVTKSGIDSLFQRIREVQCERHRRIGTGPLNRFFGEVVASHPPPMRSGKRPQLAFVTQPMVKPPTFVVATRRGGSLDESYRRYLVRQLRRRYGFEGTPLWVKFRAQSAGKARPGAS